jgi:hypothetical protein
MFPSIATNSFQLNISYFSKLLQLLSLNEEDLHATFDFNNPESLNDFMQFKALVWLIEIWIIDLEETSKWTMVKVKSGFFNPPC